MISLRFLVNEENLTLPTIATYKAALVKPLKVTFGRHVSINPFSEF